MDALQNLTKPDESADKAIETVDAAAELLKYNQQQFIAYTAFGGLLPDLNGEKIAVKISMETFANQIGVSRQTLYDWRKSIPHFWEMVTLKRKEMSSKERLSHVWNGVYMKAAAGNAEAAKLYLTNFDPDFRMPMQKVEHEAGDSLVEALGMARNRKIIEAEVVPNEPDQNA